MIPHVNKQTAKVWMSSKLSSGWRIGTLVHLSVNCPCAVLCKYEIVAQEIVVTKSYHSEKHLSLSWFHLKKLEISHVCLPLMIQKDMINQIICCFESWTQMFSQWPGWWTVLGQLEGIHELFVITIENYIVHIVSIHLSMGQIRISIQIIFRS